MKKTAALVLILSSFIASAVYAQVSFKEESPFLSKEVVQPKISDVMINGQVVDQSMLAGIFSGGPKHTYIRFSKIECDVAWNQSCSGTVRVPAPDNWQACTRVYSETYKGGHSATYSVSPGDFFTNDPESPDRFRSYYISIAASGSGNVFNQVGGRVTLENVGLTIIPATNNNQDRYTQGCELPLHD